MVRGTALRPGDTSAYGGDRMRLRGLALAMVTAGAVHAGILEVGPGRTYSTPNDAYAAAVAGDTIRVFPQASNAPYVQVRIQASKARIAFVGVVQNGERVRLAGTGFTYSGAGSTPRAMFQFNPGTDDCVVENFEIYDCHNGSYNGAAVRINQANRITVRNCEIRNNDMGLMSNGDVGVQSGADQLVENCIVHDNGNTSDPGYNHNFYMGGTSVRIRGCNVYAATTGHNIKSRAHLTMVEGSYVHDSPNRELDLVDDATNTATSGSHALVSGCVIRKMDSCPGNRGTIHFGQDGGNAHNGTLYLVNCTILTQYVTAVVTLSAAGSGARFYNCLVSDPLQTQTSGQVLIALGTASAANCGGSNLWVSRGFTVGGGVTLSSLSSGGAGQYPSFVQTQSGDYRLAVSMAGVVDGGVAAGSMGLPAELQSEPVLQFAPPVGSATRTFAGTPDIGAYEYAAVSYSRDNRLARTVGARPNAVGRHRGFGLSGREVSAPDAVPGFSTSAGVCVPGL